MVGVKSVVDVLRGRAVSQQRGPLAAPTSSLASSIARAADLLAPSRRGATRRRPLAKARFAARALRWMTEVAEAAGLFDPKSPALAEL